MSPCTLKTYQRSLGFKEDSVKVGGPPTSWELTCISVVGEGRLDIQYITGFIVAL